MKTPYGINARLRRFRIIVLITAAIALLAATIQPKASTHAAEPVTAPADVAGSVSPRQRSLLLQLADAEANIQAINKALRRTGYKVGVAYDRIENNQKGNELMDRKGGGPVRWDDFYGRTARDFYAPESWGTLHREGNGTTTDIKVASGYQQLKRPAQFDFIYKANNDQIARANEKIASFQQDQAALLARRRFHESEQSRLWSTLVLNRVQDQEISFRPLYRFRLKPAGPDAAVFRPIVRFLRIADVTSADGLQSLQTDQDAAFSSIDHRMQNAYAALQKSLADALYAPDLKAGHREQGEELKALCKRIAEDSAVISDNYHKAVDSDRAKEDASKLQFRAELQSSLAFFAAGVAQLDQQIAKTADAWGLTGEAGVANPDEEAFRRLVAATSPPHDQPTASDKVADTYEFVFNKPDALAAFEVTGNAKINVHGELDLSKGTPSSVTSKQTFHSPIRAEIEVYCAADGAIDVAPSILSYGERGGFGLWLGDNGQESHVKLFGESVKIDLPPLKPEHAYTVVLSVDQDRKAEVQIDGKMIYAAIVPPDVKLEGHLVLSGGRGHVIYKRCAVVLL